MSLGRRLSDSGRRTIRERLVAEVGGYLRYLMHSYKDLEAPARHNQTLLSVLLLAALDLHDGCIEHRLGHDIDAWAFVPSVRTDRTGEHPLHVVAKRAGVSLPEIELLTGERADPEQRVTSADRFALAANSQVRGRHVLLIEDTWTTGGNAQSAALTLRGGGAASVTIVALARWLKPEESPTGAFVMSRLTGDYDPLVCPVNNPNCTRSGRSAGD